MDRKGYDYSRITIVPSDTFEYALAKLTAVGVSTPAFWPWVEVLPTSATGPLTYSVLPNGRSGTIDQEPALFIGQVLARPTATQPYFILMKSSYFLTFANDSLKTCWLAITNLVTTP